MASIRTRGVILHIAYMGIHEELDLSAGHLNERSFRPTR